MERSGESKGCADLLRRFNAIETAVLQRHDTTVLFLPKSFQTFRIHRRLGRFVESLQQGLDLPTAARAASVTEEDATRFLELITPVLEEPQASFDDPRFRPQRLAGKRLWKLVFMVNNYCNLACTYCYEHGTVFKQRAADMSGETIRAAASVFYEQYEVIENVMFIGGEPTLSEGALESACSTMLDRAAQAGAPAPAFSMITNGVKLSEKVMGLMESFHIRPTFSIDGPPPVQDLVRIHHDKSGSFAQAKHNFDRFVDRFGERPYIEATVTRAHRDAGMSISEVVDFIADEFGVASAHVVPAGLPDNNPLAPYGANRADMVEQIQVAAERTIERLYRPRTPTSDGGSPDSRDAREAGLYETAAEMARMLVSCLR